MKVTNVTLVIYKVNMCSKNILLKLNLISCHGNKRKLNVIREVKLDVYGKRQTAKIKLLPSVFSSLYSRIKIFVFAVHSKRHFSIFV